MSTVSTPRVIVPPLDEQHGDAYAGNRATGLEDEAPAQPRITWADVDEMGEREQARRDAECNAATDDDRTPPPTAGALKLRELYAEQVKRYDDQDLIVAIHLGDEHPLKLLLDSEGKQRAWLEVAATEVLQRLDRLTA